MSKIIITFSPTDKALFAGARVVRFGDDTQHQVEPYCESLPPGATALICDTAAPEPVDEFRRYSAASLTALHNALRRADGDEPEPVVGLPQNREAGLRRLHMRILQRAKEQPLEIFNPQPTYENEVEHTREMIANADCFSVAAFRGHPKGFDKRSAKTLDDARRLAVSMHQDRPVGIYAVRGNRQIHVENYPPTADFHANPLQEKVPMVETNIETIDEPKKNRYTLGEFKSVRPSSKLGKIFRHIIDTPNATMESAGAAADMTVDQVDEYLRFARRANGVDFTVDDGFLDLVLPEGKTDEDLFVKAGAPRGNTRSRDPGYLNKAPAAEGRPVKAGSKNATMVESLLAGETLDQMAARPNSYARDAVQARLWGLWNASGIGYTVDENGVYRIDLPANLTRETCIKRPAEESAKEAAE